MRGRGLTHWLIIAGAVDRTGRPIAGTVNERSAARLPSGPDHSLSPWHHHHQGQPRYEVLDFMTAASWHLGCSVRLTTLMAISRHPEDTMKLGIRRNGGIPFRGNRGPSMDLLVARPSPLGCPAVEDKPRGGAGTTRGRSPANSAETQGARPSPLRSSRIMCGAKKMKALDVPRRQGDGGVGL